MSIFLTRIETPSGQALELSYSPGNPQSLVSTQQLAAVRKVFVKLKIDILNSQKIVSKNVTFNSQIICSIWNVKCAYFIFLVFPMEKKSVYFCQFFIKLGNNSLLLLEMTWGLQILAEWRKAGK